MGLNHTSELKVIAVWICLELLFSISSISIYYETQSNIRVKSYCRFNFKRASIFNLECFDLWQDSIGHPSKKLLSFEFDMSFRFQFGASRYITGLSRISEKNLSSFEFSRSFYFHFRACRYIIGLNRTSEYKVIFVWICSELMFSISCVSIYYGTQSEFRVKCYCL